MKEKFDVLEYQNALLLNTLEQNQTNEDEMKSALHCMKKESNALKKEKDKHVEKIVKQKEKHWLHVK